jgi:hypothetical protein
MVTTLSAAFATALGVIINTSEVKLITPLFQIITALKSISLN